MALGILFWAIRALTANERSAKRAVSKLIIRREQNVIDTSCREIHRVFVTSVTARSVATE